MKVERVNEVQMKFVLTKTDLEKRALDITDLAYGSSKTQELFQDIIETASKEFSFNLEDTPLMIEAVPMSKSSITIMLTKVSGDTQKLPPLAEGLLKKMENLPKKKITDSQQEDAMIKIPSGFNHSENKNRSEARKFLAATPKVCMIYSFDNLDQISEVSEMFSQMNEDFEYYKMLKITSSIYKYKDEYMLIVEAERNVIDKVKKMNRIFSEHGKRMAGHGELLKAYLKENAEKIVKEDALQIMAKL